MRCWSGSGLAAAEAPCVAAGDARGEAPGVPGADRASGYLIFKNGTVFAYELRQMLFSKT